MKLEAVLDQREIPYKKLWHRQAFTAQELAAEEHVSGHEVAKPVIVKGQRSFAMCVLAASNHVDLFRVAKVLNEDSVRLATEDEMQTLFPDCEVGAEPPVGALFGLKTVMDVGLKNKERLFIQSGTHTEAVRMRRDDWEQISRPIIGAIAMS